MPSAAGPIASAKNNLVFVLDTHDMPNGATPLGCGGFNGSTQGIKDLISNKLYTFENGMKLTNRTYYTAAGISYPEGNYGNDIAGCQGLYAGYNVRGGSQVYGASRSLHLWVWNNQTNSWIEGYFNGARLSGHCYDNYGGAENGWANEMAKFAADYNTVKNLFPDCTFIIVGSHACQCFRQEDVDILISLGAPSSTVGSWTDNGAWREFVLVGKPGLGSGNAYGWAYENYPTNSSQVAHLNFGLPIKTTGGMEFDGTNDYISLDSNIQSGYTQATYEFVCKPTSLPSSTYQQLYIQENSTWIALYNYSGTTFFGIDLGNGSGWFDNNGGYQTGARTTSTITANNYYHVVYSWNGTSVSIYLNGVLQSTTSTLQAANGRQNVTTLGAGTTYRGIGSRYAGSGANWIGSIDVVKFYNNALTTSEVQENYKQYKTRFNLS